MRLIRCEKVGLILDMRAPNPIIGNHLPLYTKNYVTYMAIDKLRVVGVLSYHIARKTLTSVGTFVAKSHRRNGLATDLWNLALEDERPKVVKTEPITDRGNTLIQSLKREYPKIKWVEHPNGYRTLRVLKRSR